MGRASYQHINPNLKCGKTAPKKVSSNKANLPIVRVMVKNRSKPVGSFALTLANCAIIAGKINNGLLAKQVRSKLLSKEPIKVFWNNQPAILKI